MPSNPQKPKRQPRNTMCSESRELATTKARTLECPPARPGPSCSESRKESEIYMDQGAKALICFKWQRDFCVFPTHQPPIRIHTANIKCIIMVVIVIKELKDRTAWSGRAKDEAKTALTWPVPRNRAASKLDKYTKKRHG